MTPEREITLSMDQHVGCFGKYRKNNPICRRHCALNLRCAIEYDQNERFEMLEDLVSTGGMVIKVN